MGVWASFPPESVEERQLNDSFEMRRVQVLVRIARTVQVFCFDDYRDRNSDSDVCSKRLVRKMPNVSVA